MARLVYGDFDEFADSICGVAGRFVPTARSAADWWIERARVEDIDLQQLQVGGATTFAGDGVADSVTIGMPLSEVGTIRIDGHNLGDNTFLLIRNGHPFTSSARQVARWAGITIPLGTVQDDALRSSIQRLVAPSPSDGTRATTERQLLDECRAVVGRICLEHEAVRIVDRAAATSARDDVVHAVGKMLEASTHANDRHIGRPQVSRTRVIARCLELIDASDGQPLFIDDLCAATQVSERTLRNIFQEYFGVGPMRLLKVRQLREIRSALLRANPLTDTVTKVAARFGVWDFSLFARNYRALYAEAPSQTLRRPRERQLERSQEEEALTPTWIGYAARRFMFAPAAQEGTQSAEASRTGN